MLGYKQLSSQVSKQLSNVLAITYTYRCNCIFLILQDGGEIYFSDIYVDRVLPENLMENKELWG
jgi:hypothetical protein